MTKYSIKITNPSIISKIQNKEINAQKEIELLSKFGNIELSEDKEINGLNLSLFSSVYKTEKLLLKNPCLFIGSTKISEIKKTEQLAEKILNEQDSILTTGGFGADEILLKKARELKKPVHIVFAAPIWQWTPKKNIPLFKENLNNGGSILSFFAPGIYFPRNPIPARNRLILEIAGKLIISELGTKSRWLTYLEKFELEVENFSELNLDKKSGTLRRRFKSPGVILI